MAASLQALVLSDFLFDNCDLTLGSLCFGIVCNSLSICSSCWMGGVGLHFLFLLPFFFLCVCCGPADALRTPEYNTTSENMA